MLRKTLIKNGRLIVFYVLADIKCDLRKTPFALWTTRCAAADYA